MSPRARVVTSERRIAADGLSAEGTATGASTSKAPTSRPGELVRQRTGEAWPTWDQLMQSPGWNDYDGYWPKG